jgi:hypothetical protein
MKTTMSLAHNLELSKKKKKMTNICSSSSFGTQEHKAKEDNDKLAHCHLLQLSNKKKDKTMTIKSSL